MSIPGFEETLIKMNMVHQSKNKDYATTENPLSNFDESEHMIALFKNDRDKAFAALIGTKIGRLASLLNTPRIPNNESIEDNFTDIANYVIIWMLDRRARKPQLVISNACIDHFHNQCKDENCKCECHTQVSPQCKQLNHAMCVSINCHCICHNKTML